MTLTPIQTESLLKDMQNYAGSEKVTIEVIKDTIYVFTSELGAYRINAKYSYKGTVSFSENLNTWFFSLNL